MAADIDPLAGGCESTDVEGQDMPLLEAAVAPSSASKSAVAPAVLAPIAVADLDWPGIRNASLAAPAIRARMRSTVEQLELLLDSEQGPGLLFDDSRASPIDRAIQVRDTPDAAEGLWLIGDLHGDLLALEAALALIDAARDAARDGASASGGDAPPSRIVFLGDFFDDEGLGLETLLRVFEVILQRPGQVSLVAGNHDEALAFDGQCFASSVSPSDFADFLNAHRAHEWIERAGKLAVRLCAWAPRALFFPDGLLVTHGGFPLVDLHQRLLETGDWNDPACLADFVWARAHAKARRKMPNRFSRGSQFGYEDFDDFCELSARLGRPVTHMARGHDHPEDRVETYPAYWRHPVLTTVALSRRLPRERLGPYERWPSVARTVRHGLPQPYQLQIPPDIVREVFPVPAESDLEVDAAAVVEPT